MPRYYFKLLDTRYKIPYFLLFTDYYQKHLKELRIPLFYRECIKAFNDFRLLFLSKEEKYLQEIIWYNNKIKFKRIILNYPDMFRHHIQRVGDILNHGKIDINVGTFIQKHVIRNAIPIEWFRKSVLGEGSKEIIPIEDQQLN